MLPGAVLTLPGIAGLVLTVGMAVDTHVLIFERIKDRLREGARWPTPSTGYRSAFRTIFDANITTLICAVVLYAIGSGPLQGFHHSDPGPHLQHGDRHLGHARHHQPPVGQSSALLLRV